MPMSRRCAGICVTSWVPKCTRPALACTKPASVRSSVVLPQPLGPSSVKNAPGSIASESSSITRC